MNRPPLRFHPTQIEFNNCISRIILNVSGIRSGKSFTGAYKGCYLAGKYRARGLVVSPTYPMLSELMTTYIAILSYYNIPHLAREGAKPRILLYPNTKRQAEVVFRSGSNYQKLKGGTFDWCHLDEGSIVSFRVFTEIKNRTSYAPRLSKVFGHGIVFITSTPEGRNWLYDLYKTQNTDNSLSVYKLVTAEAGIVTPEEVAYAKRTLDPKIFNQDYMGKFETWSGLVYQNFIDKQSPNGNLTTKTYNPSLPVYCGLDFGYNHNSCAIWMQYDKIENEWIILPDAFISPKITADTLFNKILKGVPIKIGGYKEYVAPVPRERLEEMARGIHPDTIGQFISGVEAHQARQEANGSSMKMKAESFGIELNTRFHRIFASISNVRRFVMDSNGDRHLFINPKGNKKIINDIQSYHYPEDRDGNPIGEEPEKDGIVDDSMDAMRYAIDTVTPYVER